MHRPTDLPRWVYIPAAVGTVFVLLPLFAIAIKVDWPNFWSLITSRSSSTALLLSLKTAAASTALCVLFGVPMALVLARSGARLVRLLRPLIQHLEIAEIGRPEALRAVHAADLRLQRGDGHRDPLLPPVRQPHPTDYYAAGTHFADRVAAGCDLPVRNR